MSTRLRKWMPIALCCLPGVAIVAVVGIGAVVSGASLSGPLGLGLIALAMLACPLSMGLMMRRGSNQNAARGVGSSSMMADCCAPGEAITSSEAASSADRLTALRERRGVLERELAEMQAQPGTTGVPTAQQRISRDHN